MRRAIIADDDCETVVGFADGTVVGWLPSDIETARKLQAAKLVAAGHSPFAPLRTGKGSIKGQPQGKSAGKGNGASNPWPWARSARRS